MSLLKRKRPLINAAEVARRVGGYSAKSVTNGSGIFKGLTVYQATPGAKRLFDPAEVERLVSAMPRRA